MAERYHVAVVGSGPGGLSAAARAAEYDAIARETNPDHAPTHILLEAFDGPAKTIHRYQKGKHVMAEPNFLDLRSPMRFRAGTREQILDWWRKGLEEKQVNVRFGAEVTGIEGQRGDFRLSLNNGEVVEAETVVLAIGTQGNPRRLGVPGEDASIVQYQLDDPEAYRDETIVVVGAGDAAIENALGLAEQNTVHIVNRRAEFARAKQGNLDAVLKAINDPGVAFSCFYESNVKRVEAPEAAGQPGAIVLDTPEGEKRVACHRIIARLGSVPPRRFVEACGVKFPDDRPTALPELSSRYESNVPGLYVIGALGGYPLIKQAMNQGFDVVETLRGNDVKPVDYELLRLQFAGLPYVADPEEILDLYQQRLPMFRRMNALQFRELVLESRVIASVPDEDARREAEAETKAVEEERWKQLMNRHKESLRELKAQGEPIGDADRAPPERPRSTRIVEEGSTIYRDGDYTSTFYTIAEGEVRLRYENDGPVHTLKAGQFFGEMSLISGRPRSGFAEIGPGTILLETPRRMMIKVMNSNEEVKRGIDWVFVVRALQKTFAPDLPLDVLRRIAGRTEQREYAAGETIHREGDTGDVLHLIRSGTVAMTREVDGRTIAIDHLQSGRIFGQMALMGDPTRRETATAAVRTETIALRSPEFLALLNQDPQRIADIQRETQQQLKVETLLGSMPEGGSIVSFFMSEGLGEATNAMLIDEDLCVGCDHCEKACAETHGGISRLDRKSGASFASVQVPISCRHCEHPHCMKDCPVDAIHRARSGEVFIDDSCIGCGNCETHCPYDAIHLAPRQVGKTGLLAWLLLGLGPAPGEASTATATVDHADRDASSKVAVKCDGCMELSGGPACVRACPTGAAIRIGPDRFADVIVKR
ncbi:cyclic nucleotide-binding domain-containing protein [Halomonas denitrificans]|nr:cyclic nucleotide-binding domain-containing protein [Halomonas denitrificans]